MTKLDDKATATITIQVDPDTARLYNAASEEDRGKLKFMLRLWLHQPTTSPAVTSLMEVMDKASDEAEARGLTPEILESLLNDV
ncbi:MAG: hypothetical protein ACR2M0_13225 [Chloroflexia bacterium]